MRKLSLFLTFALVLGFGASISAQGVNDIYISAVTNTVPAGDLNAPQLSAGKTHQIEITFDATGGAGYTWLGTNAWEMYSPDGADWGYLQGTREQYIWDLPLKYTPAIGCMALESFLKHSNKVGNSGNFVTTGTAGTIEQCFTTLMIDDPYTTLACGGNVNGNDTVGFYHGAVGTGVGYSGGTVGVALTAEFTTLKADAVVGSEKHICFDTTSQIQAWEWAAPGYPLNSGSDFPEYDNGQGVSGPICWELYDVPDPEPDWCDDPAVGNVSFNHCLVGSFQLCAIDPDPTTQLSAPFVFFDFASGYETGFGEITGDMWTWSGSTVPQDAITEIHFTVNDGSGTQAEEFVLQATSTNQAPYFTNGCPLGPKTVSVNSLQSQTFGFADDDACDVPTVSILPGDFNDPADVVTIVGNTIQFTPTNTGSARPNCTHILEVTDGAATTQCVVEWNVIIGAPYQVMIEKIKDQFQGQFADVAVDLMKFDGTQGFGGFDLLIAYDNSALAFQLAYEGDIYTDCGWEYFTYRFGPYGNCGSACPSGMLKIIGMAETNNGPAHPGCDDPGPGYVDAVPKSLAYLRFLVSNDRTLECQYVPIRFYWYDCTNNILSNHDGSMALLSDKVFDFGSYNPLDWFSVNEITGDGFQDFPTFQGATDDCIDVNELLGKIAGRYVDFQNGGVDIVCADSIDARGDINLNGLAYEIADAVMFTNYFIDGLNAFGTHVEGSIAASDTNADGIALSVADLVYLVRVVVGDAQPYAKTSPVAANVTYGNDIFNVDTEMGAAHIVMAGNVIPELLVGNMEMKYGFDGLNTNILVYSTEANQAFTGDFLRADGGIVSTEFATFAGATVVAKVMPTSFVLGQNYPNPFNPSTTFDFAIPGGGAWTLDIYNITGQLVESFSGVAESGFGQVEWDASDRSSGIYFYRLTAGDNTMTKKAVLLK